MKRVISLFTILFAFLCNQVYGQVQIIDNAVHEGSYCLVIETASATYYYEKDAGGFSRIIDRDGRDWIQFHNSGNSRYPFSAGADYRGLPNMVFQGENDGVGHPGFHKVDSKIIDNKTIYSESRDTKWAWTWTFYENHARFELIKTDSSRSYWFLYEGTIAGKYTPGTHYWGNDRVSEPLTNTPDRNHGEIEFGNWHWVYFGNKGVPRVFYLKQLEKDRLTDSFSYLGNTEEGVNAPDGMVVFGFGRKENATPLLSSPQVFEIGFYEQEIKDSKNHFEFSRFISSSY